MKITLKEIGDVKDLVAKIRKDSRKEGMRLIFEWVTTKHIDFGVFRYLVSMLPMMEEQEEYWS